MNPTISLKITDLEALLIAAKKAHTRNPSGTYPTIDIVVKKAIDTQGASDKVEARIQSAWAECNSTNIFNN